MGQRDTRHNHAKTRLKLEREHSSRGQKNHELEERAPLVGHEARYEISRKGRVYARDGAPMPIVGYHHSPFIRISTNRGVVTLNKEKAIADSFAARATSAPEG
jgi:hypothetical protein